MAFVISQPALSTRRQRLIVVGPTPDGAADAVRPEGGADALCAGPLSPEAGPASASAVSAAQQQAIEEAQAERMSARWAQAERAARERGHAEGLAAGRAQARSDAEAMAAQHQCANAQALTQALAALEGARMLAAQQVADAAGRIAFAAVVRIAGSAAVTPEFVAGVVRVVCDALSQEAPLRVTLHPADLALLERTGHEPSTTALSWHGDDSVVRGGCQVDTPHGRYDASLATQLARLHAVLVDDAEAGAP